jgi:hypothetical protein
MPDSDGKLSTFKRRVFSGLDLITVADRLEVGTGATMHLVEQVEYDAETHSGYRGLDHPAWQRAAPTPVWSGAEGEERFGFQWRGSFVEQRWTPKIESLRRRLMAGEISVRERYEQLTAELPNVSVVRHKLYGYLAAFGGYNRHGLGEFIAVFEDGERSSEMISEYCPVDGRWPTEG